MPKRPWTIESFLRKTQVAGECWEWTGYRDVNGYGDTWFNKVHIRTHRVSWILHNGPIADGLDVLHRCDNPPCVRPDHLFLGTAKENGIDMRDKGRHAHPKLMPEDVPTIREALAAGETQLAIATRFGVSQRHISDIATGRVWVTVKRVRTKHHLTAEQVIAIRAAFDAGETGAAIGSRFGITQSQVSNIGLRKQWKHI